MSGEDLEVVQRVFDAFLHVGFGAGFDSGDLAADCEWIPAPEVPGAHVIRGRDEFIEFMKTWTQDFENWSTRYERLVALPDDRVLVLAYQSATGKASGVPVDLHFGQIWEFRDGTVIRIRNYIDENSALEAAGLRE